MCKISGFRIVDEKNDYIFYSMKVTCWRPWRNKAVEVYGATKVKFHDTGDDYEHICMQSGEKMHFRFTFNMSKAINPLIASHR